MLRRLQERLWNTRSDTRLRLAQRRQPRWMQRYARLLPPSAGSPRPCIRETRPSNPCARISSSEFRPALRTLLESAAAAGEVRTDVNAEELLGFWARWRACACPPTMTATRDAWSLYSPTGYAMARTPLIVLTERPVRSEWSIALCAVIRPPSNGANAARPSTRAKRLGAQLELIGSSRVDRGLRPNELTFRDACRSSKIDFEPNSLLRSKTVN